MAQEQSLKELTFLSTNEEERYSRVPRLSDTRYSTKGTNGRLRCVSSKAGL